jgi:hypothetical protein
LSTVKWCTKHKYESIGKKKIKELPVLQESVNGNYEGYDVILLMLNSKIKKFNNKKRNT